MSKGIKLNLKLDKALVRKIATAGSKKGTHMALDHLASVSKEQVPLDMGILKNSCTVDVNDDGSAGTVSYDTPYAIVQHENRHYRHQRGRKSKYLEDPVHDRSVQNQMLELAKRGMSGEIK